MPNKSINLAGATFLRMGSHSEAGYFTVKCLGRHMIFEDRAIAFIDILGFKALVCEAVVNEQAKQKLVELVALLESAVPRLNSRVNEDVPTDLIPRHQYISDCIILSAPLTDPERPWYNGISIVIMRAIQLSHFFLNEGYLIRGGISAGKLWHTESNIIGTAYQEAYLLEQKGNEPRVQLHPNALKYWDGGSRMCLTDGNVSFVNGLFDFYIPNNTTHGVIEATYQKYERFTAEALSSSLPQSAKDKWLWFRQFLQSEKPEGLKWAAAASIQ